MLHKKLKLSAVLLLGLCLTGLQAQTLFVKEKAGTQTSLTLNNIRKLSFAAENLTVNKTDGSSGIYALSNIRYLSFTDYITNVSEQKLQKSSDILLYPNPVEDIVQFTYESILPGSMQLRIIDVQGRLVKQLEQNCESGINHVIIDVSELQPGFYICHMQNGSKTETSRFVKK